MIVPENEEVEGDGRIHSFFPLVRLGQEVLPATKQPAPGRRGTSDAGSRFALSLFVGRPTLLVSGRRWQSAAPKVRLLHRTLLSRSAMRVCHPGPVAFQRSITSAGSRSEINFRGFGDKGLPPLFTFARASISSVRSGSSSYSSGLTLWASTRARSDFKERRNAGLFAFIGFPHTENVAIRATRRVSHDNDPPVQ